MILVGSRRRRVRESRRDRGCTGRQAGRQAGTQAGTGRQAGRQAGRQEQAGSRSKQEYQQKGGIRREQAGNKQERNMK